MATHHPEPSSTQIANQNEIVDANFEWSSFVEGTEGKNSVKVLCPKCSSVVLDKLIGVHVEMEKMLPDPSSKASDNLQSSKFTHFWLVDDIFKFENCGFSNTVDSVKYLTCADCEVGPIGFQDLNSKLCYVALARVVHA